MGGKSYLPGVYSQLYRFTPTQGSWGFTEDSISDYRTIKSVLSIRDKYQEVRYNEQTRQPLNTIHNELKKHVYTCKIDMTIAAKVVDTIYEPGDDVNRELDLRYLKAINDGDVFWFKVDAFGERCHHPYTNLKSEYRKGIRFQDYQDEALMQIDIKNSQPYFSSVLNEKIIDEILPEFAAVKPLIADLQLEPDYQLYCDLCRTGMIYEYMAELMGITRKEAKGQFFGAILFSNLRVAKKFQSMKYAFIDAFPSVHHFLTIIKKMDLNSFPEIAEVLGYVSTKKFSCAMQRLESRLIIQNVSGRLIAGGIGPFITIHDSFIILPQDSSTVIKTIQDTFSDLNLPPPLMSQEMLT